MHPKSPTLNTLGGHRSVTRIQRVRLLNFFHQARCNRENFGRVALDTALAKLVFADGRDACHLSRHNTGGDEVNMLAD